MVCFRGKENDFVVFRMGRGLKLTKISKVELKSDYIGGTFTCYD